jgi:hypothetical protein
MQLAGGVMVEGYIAVGMIIATDVGRGYKSERQLGDVKPQHRHVRDERT